MDLHEVAIVGSPGTATLSITRKICIHGVGMRIAIIVGDITMAPTWSTECHTGITHPSTPIRRLATALHLLHS